jgi:hypothetical protein
MAWNQVHDHNTFDAVIYIDGVRHNATRLGARFWVDSKEFPNRHCAQHSLPPGAVLHLQAGGAVRTSGHRYSLQPPAP